MARPKLNLHSLTGLQNYTLQNSLPYDLHFLRTALISTRSLFSLSDLFSMANIHVDLNSISIGKRQFGANDENVTSVFEALYKMANPRTTCVLFGHPQPSERVMKKLERIKHTIKTVKIEEFYNELDPVISTFIESIHQNLKHLEMMLVDLNVQNVSNLSLDSLNCQDFPFFDDEWNKICQINVKKLTLRCEPKFEALDGIQNSVREFSFESAALPSEIIKYVRGVSSKFDGLERLKIVLNPRNYLEYVTFLRHLFVNLSPLNSFCEEKNIKLAISSYFNHYDLESLEEAEGELQDVSTEVQDLAKLNEHIKMEETELREITSYMFTYNQNNISFVISLDFTQIPEENIDDVMADLGIMQDEGPYDYIDNDYGDDDFDDYDHSDFDFD